MKTKRHVLFLLLVVMLVGIVPALTVTAQDSLIESLCLVTDVGSITDGTFNQFAYEGALRASEEFGLDFDYIETQPPASPDVYRKNIQTCLDDNYNAIITVGFSIAEQTTAAAQENPDTYFIGVDQGSTGEANYAGLLFREDQAGFLAGALAAQLSTSGTVAGVYGIEIPPVIKFRNGFEQGAKFVNPDITTLGVYIPSFTDQAAGGAAANSAIGEGADVVFGAGGPTGSGAIKEAAQKDVYVIGVDQDEYLTTFGNGEAPGSEFLVSSAVKRVDQAVFLAVQTLVEGGAAFPAGGNLILSASNDGVGFAEAHDAEIPEEVTARMEEILAGLKDGSIVTGVDPVAGPLLGDLFTVAEGAGNLTTLLAALEASGFSEALAAAPPGAGVTIFAPSDDAFAALPEGALDALLADPAALQGVLTYHVVQNALTSDVIAGLEEIPTFGGAPIAVSVDDSGVHLNDATVETADVLFDHGVIHIIDTVLMPPEAS
jgi:basic membrane protein A and related proteins